MDKNKELQEFTQNVYNNIDLFFIHYVKSFESPNNICLSYNEENCLSFYLIKDKESDLFHVDLDYIQKCLYSGSSSLEKLECLLKFTSSKIVYVKLYDASVITWKVFISDMNKEVEIKLSLQSLYILSKGMSWYNSLGYFENNYKENKDRYHYFGNMSMKDYLNFMLTTTQEPFKNFLYSQTNIIKEYSKAMISSLLSLYVPMIEELCDLNHSVNGLCCLIHTHIKSSDLLSFTQKEVNTYLAVLDLCEMYIVDKRKENLILYKYL